MRMSGAQAMATCLKEQGVDTLFGYPGGTILPFYDALYDSGLRHVTAAHEQGAIHAADGYARAGRRVGVCVATSGPGATNLLAGLAAAYADSVPLVAITGQVPAALIGRDAFQEVDIIGITLPVTKYSVQVKQPEKLVETLRLALKVAATGRPGPVLIDVPRDIQTALVEYQSAATNVQTSRPLTAMKEQQLDRAVALLQEAKRPLLLVGGGALGEKAADACRRLAERIGLPVVATLRGGGVMPDGHPLLLGIAGPSGCGAATGALHEADVIVAVGCRFSEQTVRRAALQRDVQLIHIDIDPAELERKIPATVALTGDAALLLPELARRAGGMGNDPARARAQNVVPQPRALTPIRWSWLFAWIGGQLRSEGGAPMTLDSEYWHPAALRYLPQTGGRLLFPGGLDCRGFAIPAALGAQLALPKQRSVAFCGAEGLLRSGNELHTIAAEKLPVVLTVLTEKESDQALVKLAAAYGIDGRMVREQAELAEAWRAAWSECSPQLLVVNGQGGDER